LREARISEKLCGKGEHPNLIQIFRHGWFPDRSYYYIDMELGEFSLDRFIAIIKPRRASLKGLSKSARNYLKSNTTVIDHHYGLTLTGILKIMSDITSGIAFIHSRNMVHRDLTPRNGTNDPRFYFCSYCVPSSLLFHNFSLENH